MRPQPSDYPSFYKPYVELVPETDAKTVLKTSLERLKLFLNLIPESSADFAY